MSRNNSPIGRKVHTDEELVYLEKNSELFSSTFNKRLILTIFGREFKYFERSYDRKTSIATKGDVGFKK